MNKEGASHLKGKITSITRFEMLKNVNPYKIVTQETLKALKISLYL